jgi:hypothetical protein
MTLLSVIEYVYAVGMLGPDRWLVDERSCGKGGGGGQRDYWRFARSEKGNLGEVGCCS